MDSMDILAIQAVLPHRYPFLLVDRVDERSPDRILARKLVTANEPFFTGHFPGNPIMPGVLIVEALAQAAGLLAASQVGFDPKRDAMVLMAADKVKFRKPVVPGDVLLLSVVATRKGSAVWKFRGEASVGDVLVAEAELLAGVKQARPT